MADRGSGLTSISLATLQPTARGSQTFPCLEIRTTHPPSVDPAALDHKQRRLLHTLPALALPRTSTHILLLTGGGFQTATPTAGHRLAPTDPAVDYRGRVALWNIDDPHFTRLGISSDALKNHTPLFTNVPSDLMQPHLIETLAKAILADEINPQSLCNELNQSKASTRAAESQNIVSLFFHNVITTISNTVSLSTHATKNLISVLKCFIPPPESALRFTHSRIEHILDVNIINNNANASAGPDHGGLRIVEFFDVVDERGQPVVGDDGKPRVWERQSRLEVNSVGRGRGCVAYTCRSGGVLRKQKAENVIARDVKIRMIDLMDEIASTHASTFEYKYGVHDCRHFAFEVLDIAVKTLRSCGDEKEKVVAAGVIERGLARTSRPTGLSFFERFRATRHFAS